MFPDAWSETAIVTITRQSGPDISFEAMTTSIDIDSGDKETEGLPNFKGGRIEKWTSENDTTLTIEGYPIDAKQESGSGLAQHFHGMTLTMIDSCDVTTGWTDDADAQATTVNSTTTKQNSLALNLGKNGTSALTFNYSKTITATNMTSKVLKVWLYVADAGTITSLDTSAANKSYIELGTSGFTNVNRYYFGTSLVVGWNYISCIIDSPDTTSGSGANEASIDSIKILFTVDTTGTTITLGNLIMDYWHLAMDQVEPIGVNNSLLRHNYQVALLWTNDTTASLKATGATAASTDALRFIAKNAKLISFKESFTDNILKSTFKFKCPAFTKSGTANITWESGDNTPLVATASYGS